MQKKYRWAILGAGSIAKKFASDLKLLPGAELYAVGSKDIGRAQKFASEQGFKKAYGSYEELVSDTDVDIIYIASRHIGHYPDAVLCMNHGKAVLCEKPVSMNRQQFEKMTALAVDKDVFFMEALWTRFIPSFLKLKELIEKGEIGKIRIIESDFCFMPAYDPEGRLFNPGLGGGALLDVGLYPVFLALEIGGQVTGIKAMATFDKTGVDNSCSVLLSHTGGELSILYTSIITNGRVESYVQGEKGSIRLNKWWHTPTSLDLFVNDKKPVHFEFPEPGFGYQYEAAEVMKCLDRGAIQSDLFSWEHSRRLLSILDRIREMTGIRYSEEIEAV
jgi:predicted dehydrogenase